MSVFHRIDDIESMPGPKFLRFARRMTCYQGVLAARLAEEIAAKQVPVEPTPEAAKSDRVAVHAGGGKELAGMVHRALSMTRS